MSALGRATHRASEDQTHGTLKEPAHGPRASVQLPLDCDPLRRALRARLNEPSVRWLDEATTRLEHEPNSIGGIFPAVGRAIGRTPLHADADLADLHAWTLDAAARTLLLVALKPAALAAQLPPLYRHGDAAERCGALRALAYLPIDQDVALPLVQDALRTNDSRLIAAALGPYALLHLDEHALAHAALKCLFLDVPLAGLVGLQHRLTAEMAQMLARYAHERIAAGRTVPAEIWPLIDRFPPAAELAAIEAELDRPEPTRRTAARAALHARAVAGNAATDERR